MQPQKPQPAAASASGRRALIDIGTNSIKLLVAEVKGDQVEPIIERATQTRLGSGLYEDHQLRPQTIAATTRAVAEFVQEARALQALGTRVIATSAVREARNSAELLDAIQTVCGLPVEVISGEQEARWVFEGVRTDPRFRSAALLVMDAGGGSTEIIFGDGERPRYIQSFAIGTVRLYERMAPSDPPQHRQWQQCRQLIAAWIEHELKPQLAPLLESEQRPVQLVGTGGTPAILARMTLGLTAYDRAAIESAVLPLKTIATCRERLWSLPFEQRKLIPGLPPDRADVILPGVALFETLMELLGFPHLRVSTRGLRFAAVRG